MASGGPALITPRRLLVALLLLLVIVSLAYLLRPIADPDFFWHLKSGEWIREHRRLPASDQFSFTGNAVATKDVPFTLTAYWVSQLLYHFGYALAGLTGIVVLRLVIWAALLAAVWKRRAGDALLDGALLLVFAVAFLERYPLERPQVHSFLFFAVLLVLLNKLKEAAAHGSTQTAPPRGYRAPLFVALLMLVWANVHGGFVLGQAAIVVYLAAEGVKFAHGALRPIRGEAYRGLLVAGVAGLAASFVNPNTWHGLGAAFYPGPPAGTHGLIISEYQSLVDALQRSHDYTKIVVLVLMLLAAVSVISRPRRVDLTEALLVAGTGYFAFKHVRHAPIFMIAVLPMVGRFLSLGPWVRWTRAAAIAAALVLVSIYATDERHGLERLRTGVWVDPADYPVAAADFIVASGLRGNMYNYYRWGGYLIWRLAPERKVFADGRNINPGVLWQCSLIDLGFELPGQNSWRALLAQHDIGYVVVPVERRGKPLPLVERLSRDPDWVKAFASVNSTVFVRR